MAIPDNLGNRIRDNLIPGNRAKDKEATHRTDPSASFILTAVDRWSERLS